MGVGIGSQGFGGNLAFSPSGSTGALSVTAGKTSSERASWSLNRFDGTAQIRLRLPAREAEFDLDYRGRQLSVRVTRRKSGVERWGGELKLVTTQPSFRVELREQGKAPQVVELKRDAGLWKTM